MTRRSWIICLIVSLLASAIAPAFTMVAWAPADGSEVIDFAQADLDKPFVLSEQADAQHGNVLPMRRISGLERFTYWFSQPDLVVVYMRSAAVYFLVVFGASVIAVFLCVRNANAD